MSNHQSIIKEISTKLTERKNSYGAFLIKSFIQKQAADWKNIVTEILPISSRDGYENIRIWDYGEFALVEDLFSMSDVLKMIDVPQKSDSSVEINGYSVQFQNEYWSKVHTYDSGSGPFNFNWYCEVYRLRTPTPNIGYNPLVAVRLPFFPDRRMVIKDFIGIDIDRFSDAQGIILCLPNFSARIKELKIGPTKIGIEIEEKFMKSKEIIGKLYCEKDQQIRKQDVTFKNGVATVDVGFKPDYLHFVIISKSNANILDSRQFHKEWGDLSRGVIVDVPNYQLKELIRNGETETVEFKADIGKPEEFAETVVSFSNSRGGIIMVGVNDNSRIVGLKKAEYKDRITKIIRSHVDPFPILRFEERKVENKRLMLLFIEEGEKKPYILKDKGPYVRANGTDRIATKFELDEFYKRNQTVGFEVRY